MTWGEAGRSRYLQFFHAVTRAETEAEATLVQAWNAAGKIDWRAARDMLARRFPERWAQSKQPDIQGGTSFQINIHLEEDQAALPLEQRRRVGSG
jgi:hypothetical protein